MQPYQTSLTGLLNGSTLQMMTCRNGWYLVCSGVKWRTGSVKDAWWAPVLPKAVIRMFPRWALSKAMLIRSWTRLKSTVTTSSNWEIPGETKLSGKAPGLINPASGQTKGRELPMTIWTRKVSISKSLVTMMVFFGYLWQIFSSILNRFSCVDSLTIKSGLR